MVGARDGQSDRLGRQGRVDLVPGGVGIVDELAVDRHLGSNGLEHLDRGQGEIGARSGGGEDDAVEAELDFADVGHAIGGAGFALAVLDRTAGIGDVDGVFADAFTKLAEAAAGAARTHDRGLELGEGGAELFGHDRGEGEDGGRAGDLDGVARLGKSRGAEGGERDHGGAGEKCGFH